MDIIKVLTTKYPEAQWSITGNDYESIEWLSDGEKPTPAELEAAWPDVELQVARNAIRGSRQVAYQNTVDPLFFKWQAGEATEAEWKAARAAVVEAYPYPIA